MRDAEMFVMCNMLSVTGCRIQTTTFTYGSLAVARVVLNGDEVFVSPSNRGINIVLINHVSCTHRETRTFDTYLLASEATALRDYLQGLKTGDVVVAVTADAPVGKLDNALDTLKQWGADVSDVEIRGTFTFVAQKGYPKRTTLVKVPTEEESQINPASLDVTISGMQTVAISFYTCVTWRTLTERHHFFT